MWLKKHLTFIEQRQLMRVTSKLSSFPHFGAE